MKIYTLNDYYNDANSTDSRVEVYSDNITAANLLSYHKQNGAIELTVCECVGENTPILPMPDTIMQALDTKIFASKKRVIVTGIDAYLSLLSRQNVEAFMTALHRRIDDGKLNAAYLICRNYFGFSTFINPKYEDSLQIVHIGDTEQVLTKQSVNIVSQKYVQEDNNPTTWKALLKKLGQFESAGEYTLILNDFTSNHAGLSDNVMQLLDIFDIAEQYYEIPASLPRNVLEILVTKSKEDNVTPYNFLETQFVLKSANTRYAIKRLLELQNDEIWPAYVWFLKKTIDSGSYLAVVLSSGITKENFLRMYTCDTAVSVLADKNAKIFANERASAIKEIKNIADALIINFIENIKKHSNNTVACWLNCDTEAEQIEIVRRVSENDLSFGLPQIWHNLYPLLADYLSDEYDYVSTDLTSYFREYRRLKIANNVTDDFMKMAFISDLPPDIPLRDEMLYEFAASNDTALLVVDGMGAEYFPLIHAMAKRKALNIQIAVISAVKLPSSTKFNPIKWDESRRLKPNIHGIDNILHNGAEKHEKNSPARNIVAALGKFENITNRIANALTSYECVVVTSDHGSSRLAVLAHEKEMGKNIEWDGNPQDWRYAVAPPNMTCSTEFEPFYDIEKNITYWVVRGYNRLPKKGPKLNELHGGATLEERLVPMFVFSKEKSVITTKQLDKQIVGQQIEEKEYDI